MQGAVDLKSASILSGKLKKYARFYFYCENKNEHEIKKVIQDLLKFRYPEQTCECCVFDPSEKLLVLAADITGIIPLYYRYSSGCLEFSDRLSFFCRGTAAVSSIATGCFLRCEAFPGKITPVLGVSRLLPGQALICSEDSCREITIYSPVPSELPDDEKDCCDMLRELLKKSMKKSAENNSLLMFSGGIDSSSVLSLNKDLSEQLRTFSIRFSESSFCEEDYRRKVLSVYSSEHQEYTVTLQAYAEKLEKMICSPDPDILTAQEVPAFTLALEAASINGKSLIFGLPADELFFGYPWMIESYLAFTREKQLQNFKISFDRQDFSESVIRHLGNEFFLQKQFFSECSVSRLTREEIIQGPGEGFLHDDFPFDDTPFHQQLIMYNYKRQLPCNQYLRLNSIAHLTGNKIVLPYADPELLNFALGLDIRLQLKNRDEKHILKETFRRLLPDETVRRKKQGFQLPLCDWLKDRKMEFVFEYVSDNCHRLGFSADWIRSIRNDDKNWLTGYEKIWSVLTALTVKKAVEGS